MITYAYIAIDEHGQPLQSRFHSTAMAVFADREWGMKFKPQGSRLVECEIKIKHVQS